MLNGNFAGITSNIIASTMPKIEVPKNRDYSSVIQSIGDSVQKIKNTQKMNRLAKAIESGDKDEINLAYADLNPQDYIKRLQGNEDAERDQQYKMDYLGKQFENALALEDKRNANAVGLQRLANSMKNNAANEALAQRKSALDEEFKAGRMSKESYDKAMSMLNLGSDLYKIAYGNSGVDFDPKGHMELRKEFFDKEKDYFKLGDSMAKIKKAAENPSAAGDISLVFGYMKMLDPNSVVREGEYATAQNATGVPQRVINAYNRALSGERLSEDQRNDFLSQSQNIFDAQTERFNKDADFYRKIAEQSGYNADYIINNPYDFNKQQPAPAGNVQVGQTIGGFKIIGVE